MKLTVGVLVSALAMVAPLSMAAAAQQRQQPDKQFTEARGSVKPVPLPPGGPAPRMSDGHVDLSGVWFSGPTGKANAWSVVPDTPLKEDPVPFQPAAAAKIRSMTRTERELKSPGVTCQPVGTPGMWTINPYPHQIVMKAGLYVQPDRERQRVERRAHGRPSAQEAGRPGAPLQRRSDGALGR